MTRQTPARASGRDHFPDTQYSWIGRCLLSGTEGRDELNRHVMSIYAAPLRYYFVKTTVRWLGDAEEIIDDFFKDRLARRNFFDSWQESNKPLRYWLINALNFFLREEYRRRQRDKRQRELPEDAPLVADGPSAEALMDQAFKIALVQNAARMALVACEAAGLDDHWRIFVAHYYEGRPYGEIAPDFGTDPARAAVMARTARGKFVHAVREALERDGVAPENIDREIAQLLESETTP